MIRRSVAANEEGSKPWNLQQMLCHRQGGASLMTSKARKAAAKPNLTRQRQAPYDRAQTEETAVWFS